MNDDRVDPRAEPLTSICSGASSDPLHVSSRVRLVLDWDGTVVEEDILAMALERFGDLEVFERGELTWAESMELGVATLRASLEEVNAWIAERVRIRAGFRELVARHDAMILTGNFEELVRPVLTREGLDLEVVGNQIGRAHV